MADRPELIAFASREAMAARLADLIEAKVLAGVGEIAVSGGSTPKPLYEELAQRDLLWSETSITLVDERWVAPDHSRSNEAFVRSAFSMASGVTITGLYSAAPTPAEAVPAIGEKLGARVGPFDVVVLGMGNDGHTASWFPHAEGLNIALESETRVCVITAKRSEVTGEEVERMTLTMSAIRDARLIILMMTGADKRATFEKALEDGPVEDMPVRAILRARPDLWVCWAP